MVPGTCSLDRPQLLEYLRQHYFRVPDALSGSCGVVLEWMVKDAAHTADGACPAPHPDVGSRIATELSDLVPHLSDGPSLLELSGGGPLRLPHGGHIGFSSGGQIRYESPLLPDPVRVVTDVRLHVGGLLHRLGGSGLRCVFQGMDPYHDPSDIPLHLTNLRQRLMEAYLDQIGTHGQYAMRCAYALQVNLHPGFGMEGATRLAAADRLAPIMAAIFAHSPLHRMSATPFVTRRLHHILNMDPARTAPVGWRPDEDPAETLLKHALAVPVMLKDDGLGGAAALADSPTFQDWCNLTHPQGPPTLLDWQTHLSTLFPPVRHRGQIEIRITDAQEFRWFPVPLMLWWSLLWIGDPNEWCEPASGVTDIDRDAIAERGIRNPNIVVAAHKIFDRALEILETSNSHRIPVSLLGLVRAFRLRYLDRGRMPADDLIDRQHHTPGSGPAPSDHYPAGAPA
ncbi:MAG: hypothetical protein CMJ83_08995 [Planctomycetes bacterium]|nr:hypothetical protein [Planctomycetota bacterium]